jgi:OOP family OmpA-OmpF porin
MRRILPFALAALASGGAAVVATDAIETRSERAVRGELRAEGLDFAEVRADGLRLTLRGEAPGEAVRARAMAAAGRVTDPARVVDAMTSRTAVVVEPPAHTVEMLRGADGLSLIGLVPAGTDRAAIVARLERATGAPVSDFLDVAARGGSRDWAESWEFGLTAVAHLPRSKVSVEAGRVAVTAAASSPEERRRLLENLARVRPEGLDLDLEVTAPRPVVAPFTLRFEAGEDGPRLVACAAATEAGAAAIEEAARGAGAPDPSCRLGLGSPSPRWPEAARLAVEAVSAMGGGAVTLADTEATLVAPHALDPERFDEVAGALEGALPPAFSLTATAPQEVAAAAPRFLARVSEGGVALAGRLPDERARDAARSLARARFPGAEVTVATRTAPGLPEGWPQRAMAGIEALALLKEGQVRVERDAVSLTGVAASAQAEARAAGLLSRALGAGVDIRLDVSYDPTLDEVVKGPTATECAARIEAAQALGKIAFDAGSDEIAETARGTVKAIAEVLRDCPPIPMEVAGHTDAQGREAMNLELSQARAEAVVEALARAGAPVSALVPVGYGESRPIAEDTPTGREANRRIEFTPLEPRGDPRLVSRRLSGPALAAPPPSEPIVEAVAPGPDTPRPEPRPEPGPER